MDDLFRDAVTRGLIRVVRKPRSEKLVELIRSTKSYTAGFWLWLDWERANRN